MVWLFVLGLCVWCLVQQIQLGESRDRLSALRQELLRLIASKGSEPAAPAVEAAVAPEPVPQAEPEPAVEPVAVIPAVQAAAAPSPQATPAPREPAAPRRSTSDWLSENGLAWIGGGALALGGLLLVAYAAQHGLFTPAFRIASAVLLGLLALAAGEGMRRGIGAKISPNLLVAALTTAAGAAILYAAIWASYSLYGFVAPATAGVLLTCVSFGLLALALLHGQALGVLAIGAAYAVPVVSGSGEVHSWPLGGFALLILATGMTAAGVRRWAVAGAFALAGAGLWALVLDFESNKAGITLLAASAPVLAIGALALARRFGPSEKTAVYNFAALLVAAVIGSGTLAMLLWSSSAPGAALCATIATSIAIVSVAIGMGGFGVSPRLLIVPAVVTTFAALRCDAVRDEPKHVLWLLPSLALLAGAGFVGALASSRRREAALIGAAGTALTLTVGAIGLANAAPGWDWAIDAGFAALLAAGAVALARRADDAGADLATAAWIAAAAEAAGLALHAGLDGRFAPTAYGLLGVVLAGLAVRVKWRGFAESAAVAALAGFAALLASPVAGAAITGAASWFMTAGVAAGAVAAQIAAWRVLKARKDALACIEAISTLAVMSALLGAFLVLQTLGAPRGGLDDFTKASLRTLLILAAGLMLSIRGAATPLGRWRAPAFLAIGALHGLVLQGMTLHPWWGAGQPVAGPPIFDSILLGLLAPALMLAEASRRVARQTREIAVAAFAAALLFLALWMVTELRRLFHGPVLAGPFGYAEVAAYGAAMLALALGLEAGRARLGGLLGAQDILRRVFEGVAWTALLLALWLLAVIASPWWGPLDGDLRAPALLGALYAAACGLSAGLARMARRSGRPILAHTALVATGIELLVLLSLAIRFVFHGGAMRVALREASLETWTFSAVWALYGLIVLAGGASRRDTPLRGLGLAILLGTTLKVFLFDMARLEGVIRAASFLALGVVLLAGALAARRLGGAKAG